MWPQTLTDNPKALAGVVGFNRSNKKKQQEHYFLGEVIQPAVTRCGFLQKWEKSNVVGSACAMQAVAEMQLNQENNYFEARKALASAFLVGEPDYYFPCLKVIVLPSELGNDKNITVWKWRCFIKAQTFPKNSNKNDKRITGLIIRDAKSE